MRISDWSADVCSSDLIALAGGVAEAVRRARGKIGHLVKVEVEVDTLEQLDEVMTVAPDAVLLDNMTPDQLARAAEKVQGRALTEAAGRITLEPAATIAPTGVTLLSAGRSTHSSTRLDQALN